MSFMNVINLMMARTASTYGGHIGLMTMTAGGQIEAIAWNTSQGFSTALSTFVAQNFAARKKERVLGAYHTTLKMTALFGIFCTLLFVFFGSEVFSLIIPEKAAYEAELHSYEKSVLTAFKETRNAIVNFNKIKEVYALRANLERSAKSYMDLAQLQYINGVINYLDVLDAQRGYFDAQIGLSNAIRDELITVVQLYKALGGGWKQ